MTTQKDNSPTHRKPQKLRIAKIILASLLSFLIVLSAVISLVLSQQNLREWLLETALPSLLSSDTQTLKLSGVSSPSLGRWHVKSMHLSVDQTRYVEGNSLSIHFDPFSLLEGKLTIHSLLANSIALKLPSAKEEESPADNSFQLENWQDLLPTASLDELSINRIAIKTEAFELPPFQIHGSAQTRHKGVLLGSELTLKTLTEQETTFHLQTALQANLSGNIQLSLKEQSGGWLTTLLQLPKAQDLDIDITMLAQQQQDQIHWEVLSLKSTASQSILDIDANGSWQTSAQRLQINEAIVRVDGKPQKLTAWWQGSEFSVDLKLKALPLSLVDAFQDEISGGQLDGSLFAEGHINNPSFVFDLTTNTTFKDKPSSASIKGSGNLNAIHFDYADIKLGEAHAKAQGKILIEQAAFDLAINSLTGPSDILNAFDVLLPEDLSFFINHAKGQLTGTFTAPHYAGEADANISFKTLSTQARSEFKGDVDKIKLTNFKASLDEARLKANGLIDWHNEILDLETDATQLSLAMLSRADIDLPDSLNLALNAKGSVKGNFQQPTFDGTADAKGAYKGQALKVSLVTDSTLHTATIKSLQASLGPAKLSSQGKVFIDRQHLDMNVDTLFVPSHISALFDLGLPKDLDLNVTMSNARLTGPISAPHYEGTVSANGHYLEQDFIVESRIDGNLDNVNLKNLNARIKDALVKAEGNINWQQALIDLQIESQALPLELLKLLRVDLPDKLTAKVSNKGSLKGPFSGVRYEGDLSMSGEFDTQSFSVHTDLAASPDTIKLNTFIAELDTANEKATIKANGRYHIQEMALNGELAISALPYSVIALAGIELPSELTGNLNTELKIDGQLPFPLLSGQLSSHGQYKGESFNIDLAGLQKGDGIDFKDTLIKWRDSTLKLKGSLSKEKFDLHFNLSQLQLEQLNNLGLSLPNGALNLIFDLRGTPESPVLNGQLAVALMQADVEKDETNPGHSIKLVSQFHTEDEALILRTRLQQKQTQQSQTQQRQTQLDQLTVKTTYLPFIHWSLEKNDLRTFSELPLNIELDGAIGLDRLNEFIDNDIQQIAGQLSLNSKITGSSQQPNLQGLISLQKGSYVNALSQTTLNQADIRLALNGRSIKIVKAVAQDGQSGKISLAGALDLDAGRQGMIDFILSLNNASLVRREDIEGEASGQVSLKGNLKKLSLDGKVAVSPFQIMLDLIPSDTIPEIKISKRTEQASLKKQLLPQVDLDILLAVDQQAYIRGRGLDAELKGQLKLSGSLDRPNYNGQFKTVRGSYELFSKTFKLTEGDVLFSNEAVSLFVQGRHSTKDRVYFGSLSGTLDKLSIGLRTEPPLPEDEALARLLFGKSVKDITPFQAIQLASAIQTLRGEGGGFDPLGEARDLLKVDNITIESQETSEGKGLAVGVGKHITDGVYVEISRTPEPTQPWKGSVEVELTPNINLETTTGGSSGFGGVELQWKNDY